MSRKYFGTDGVRGRVGKGAITPDFALKLGWAAGKVLGKVGAKVIIGKDPRRSGYMFESALEAGFNAAGVDVYLLGPMPTPAVAYLTQTFQAVAGVVVSASHNPHYDNGIKFFSANGAKLSDDIEIEIEKYLDKDIEVVDAPRIGKSKRIEDAQGRYVEFCKSSIPYGYSLNNLRIVLDCANGATFKVAPMVFKELGAEVITLFNEPNGTNINDNCGAVHPEALSRAVLEYRADLGLAFDGDGDRLIAVDGKGNIIDGDAILYALAVYGDYNGVAGTIMSNYRLELVFQEKEIPFARANVGDRYVIEKMKENDWNLGGEGSGHILCKDKTTTGDGIIAALQFIVAVLTNNKNFSDILSDFVPMPQVMINLKIDETLDEPQKDKLANLSDDYNDKLSGEARVVLRASGTEPVVRVMVESQDEKFSQDTAEEISQVIKEQIL